VGTEDLLEGDILELARRCAREVYMLVIDHKGNDIVVIKDHLEPPGRMDLAAWVPESKKENTATGMPNQENGSRGMMDPTVAFLEILGLHVRRLTPLSCLWIYHT